MIANNIENNIKMTKPNQKGGRKLGSTQWRRYNWHITYFDKKLDKLIIGKYCTVSHINKELGTKFSSDLIYRLQFITPESKNTLMVKRWSHIKVVKIDEEIFKDSTLSIYRVNQEDLKNYQNQKKIEKQLI